VRIAAETTIKIGHLLVEHRVIGYAALKVFELRFVGQLAVKQEIADFEKATVFGKLVNRISAIEKLSLVAVNIRDCRIASSRRGESGIVGELSRLLKKSTNVDDRRAYGCIVNWKFNRFAINR